jgi:hypothetical protein
MSYEQAGRVRHVVRLQLTNPVSAAFEKLLALKEGRDAAATHAAADTTGPGDAAQDAADDSHGALSPASGSSAKLAAEVSEVTHDAAPASTRHQ